MRRDFHIFLAAAVILCIGPSRVLSAVPPPESGWIDMACTDHTYTSDGVRATIAKCDALIHSGRLDRGYQGVAYERMGDRYLELAAYDARDRNSPTVDDTIVWKAIGAYKLGLKYNPHMSVLVYDDIGRAFVVLAFHTGKPKDEVLKFAETAVAYYSKAIAGAGTPDLYAERGRVYAQLCRDAKARADYQKAIEIANTSAMGEIWKYKEALAEIASDCRDEFRRP